MGNSKYYKHPQYGMVYGQSAPTPIGRTIWPHLVTPKDAPPPKEPTEKQGPPRYEVTLLLEKENPAVMKFVDLIKLMTDEMLPIFNQKRSALLGQCMLFGKSGDGDEMDHEKYPFCKGMWLLVARNTQVVKVVNTDKPKPKVIEASSILGGIKGKLVICPMITAHGISYKLEAVQFVLDDGQRFGGAARDATELFDACEDDEVESDNPKVAENGSQPDSSQKAVKKGKAAALDLL